MNTPRALWIFAVTSGRPFALKVKGNPMMKHDGRRSVLRCLCTDEEAKTLIAEMETYECRVVANSPREDAEQKAKRQNLFAILGQDVIWPTQKCPGCAWLDPEVEGMCGAGMLRWKGFQGWGDEAIQERLTVDRFATDFFHCPLGPVTR